MMKHRQFSPTFASTTLTNNQVESWSDSSDKDSQDDKQKTKTKKSYFWINHGWLRSYYETSASTTLTRWIVDQTDKDKDKDKDSHEDSDKNKDS